MDKLSEIKIIASTPNPQRVVYGALHQCYSPNFVATEDWPSEERCGEIIVQRLLAGDRGHFSPLEVASITFAVGYFPHSVVQQVTRHRHLSFSVQSFRYTGDQIIEAAQGIRDIESVFYLRPICDYTDRGGKRYRYTEELRDADLAMCKDAAEHYRVATKIYGVSEEQARGMLPFDYRQHFVMSCNARSLMHLFDLRLRKDSQLEIQWFTQLLLQRFEEWMPQVADWYKQHRSYKGRLAP